MRGENKKMSAILKSSSAISTTSSSSRTSTSTTSTFTGSSTSFTPGTARTSSRQADPLHRSSSDSSLSRLAVSGGGGRSSDGLRSGTPSGTQPSGNWQFIIEFSLCMIWRIMQIKEKLNPKLLCHHSCKIILCRLRTYLSLCLVFVFKTLASSSEFQDVNWCLVLHIFLKSRGLLLNVFFLFG